VDQAGDRRGFGWRQISNLLAEERARALPHPEDPDGFGLAEVDVVEVGLEDLLLRHARLEDQRQHRLVGLARERALWRKEEVLGQLLRDRASSLSDAATTEVDPDSAQESERIDSGMRREARILGCEHSRHDVTGKVVERKHATLAEHAARIGTEELRLDCRPCDLAAVHVAYRLDHAAR
jgi:hypothetical protein